jgi:hypothetical protein
MEIHFSREDFDSWLSNLTAGKFKHYLAWFNINIKQINQQQPQPSPIHDHDFRINVPVAPEPPVTMSVLDRLKMTAHRRTTAAGGPVVQGFKEEKAEKPIHSWKQDPNHPKNAPLIVEAETNTRIMPSLQKAVNSGGANKKRTREEFEMSKDVGSAASGQR